MGNIVSYYTGDQDFRIGYPTDGSLIQQIYRFRLHSVDFQASNATMSNGWVISSVSDGGSYFDVTFSYEPSGVPTNLDLTTLSFDEMLIASLDTSISELSNSTFIEWYTDKDDLNSYETTQDDAEALLVVKSGTYAEAIGDPHISPLHGKSYDLPVGEHTFLLYSNGDSEFPVTIKAKCWYLPERFYAKKIERMFASGYIERAQKHLTLFQEGTFFKYIEFYACGERIVIDMNSFAMHEFTSLEDVDSFSLPPLSIDSYNGTHIEVSRARRPAKGFKGSVPDSSMRARKVVVKYYKFPIVIRLLKSPRNISIRNGIELNIDGSKYGQRGALFQNDVVYTEFGLNSAFMPSSNVVSTL